ncbi:MAG: chromosome segregation protein [Verrucomicrobiales bacterium]|jgi:chromosome segregation protein
MFLKSLQIHGFKSFADNTTIEFHPGVTGIVGPNGCGKSNVVDAIRWVLGERSAKALRGGEMADVIFNGTDKRKPLGMAEVSLTLGDCESTLGVDYNEVQITRRVYRDGHSEYRLNGSSCRLQDITSMLMDTGIGQAAYSILEQGKIDQLLSSRPEDRRAVFEEAAGITKFKSEKREALRKLEYTEANLLRVFDLLAEHKRRISSLQRQAAKARRYQALLTDVRTLDTHFSFRRYEEMSAEKAELVTSITSLRTEQEEVQASIDSKEQLVAQQRDELRGLEEQLAQTQQRISDQNHQIQGATNRIEFNDERRRELQSLMEQNEQEIESAKVKLVSQEEELAATQTALIEIAETLRVQEGEIETFRASNDNIRHDREKVEAELRQLRQKSHETESQLAKIEAQLGSNRSQSETDERRSEQLLTEFGKFVDDKQEKEQDEQKFYSEIDEAKSKVAHFEGSVRELNEQVKTVQQERNEMEDKVTMVNREVSRKKSRLDVLRQMVVSGEGFKKGTQAVLRGFQEDEDLRDQVHGALSSFIKVEPDFITAVETALGDHLQTVVVGHAEAARKIVAVLTEDGLGEAAILPKEFLDEVSGPVDPQNLPEGAICWALDKVEARETVAPFLRKLIGNVVIVGSLEDAIRLRAEHKELSFVTTKGTCLSDRGVIRGGRNVDDSGSVLQRQQEIAELDTECRGLQEKLVWHEAALEEITQGFNELRAGISEDSQQLQEARVYESTLQGRLSAVQREAHQLKSKIEGIDWEKGELAARLGGLREAVEGLVSNRTAQEQAREQLEQRVQELDAELASISDREAVSNDQLGEMRTTLAVEQRAEQALRQQREPMETRVQELKELLVQRSGEIESYRERNISAGGECERLKIDIEKAAAIVEQFTNNLQLVGNDREAKAEGIRELEQELGSSRKGIAHLAEQRGKEEVKSEKIELRIESLMTYVRERYQVDLATFEQDFHGLLLVIEDQKKAHSSRSKRRATLAAKEETDDAVEGESDKSSSEDEESIEPVDLEELQAAVAEGEEALEQESESDEDSDSDDDAVDIAELEEQGPDWEFIDSVLGELKQRLDSMGPVNLDAIAEYEELEADLVRQQRDYDDLENSKTNLHSIIRRLNIESRKKFSETFDKVRSHFQKVFKELFGHGSKADLLLLDENDPLESGIEVIAKPPGKKLQSITLMSGGERSMTAVALLFSIYKVKPSPFCVLDELDAPLDDSNIGRFLKMLDEFVARPVEGEDGNTSKSQFIIVTHNKRTMHRADVLYGVTMQEFGVSKPIGMKMVSEQDSLKGAETAANEKA